MLLMNSSSLMNEFLGRLFRRWTPETPSGLSHVPYPGLCYSALGWALGGAD